MFSYYEIPLSPNAQRFTIDLQQVTYNMMVVWNAAMNCWVLDIADLNNSPLLQGLPIVTGIDLLTQFAHLGIGGALVAMTDSDLDKVPTYANLGDSGHLYFVTGP